MPDKTKFEQGDIVKLKSGGPKMTIIHAYVERYDEGGILEQGGELLVVADSYTYTCKWFIKDQLKEGRFPEGVLEIVPA